MSTKTKNATVKTKSKITKVAAKKSIVKNKKNVISKTKKSIKRGPKLGTKNNIESTALITAASLAAIGAGFKFLEKNIKTTVPKVYISGPISELAKEEAEANFEQAEKYLREKGFNVVNPLKINNDDAKKMEEENSLAISEGKEVPHNINKIWQAYMREDLKELLKCNTIFMLNAWADSRGANIEYDLASDLGMIIIYQGNQNLKND